MAKWRKYFKGYGVYGQTSPVHGNTRPDIGYRNYQSQLPEVYIGHPNRIERYNQYEQMDQDSEINACLDILADFCTQVNEENHTSFRIEFHDEPTDNELKVIKEQLQQWYNINEFDKRIFKLFRNTIKYGDQVFIRDPETFKLNWVDMSKVVKVIVNESAGKEPEQYVIKDININLQNLTVTQVSVSDVSVNHPQVGGPNGSYTQPNQPYAGGSRFDHKINEDAIEAQHVVHFSLTEGLDVNWPFGNSVLENIFKVFKQKELIEDAMLIYRIQRAPERRVFYIDVGNMPSHLAMAFLERVKNEIHQRRIPSQCLALDTKIPLLDGRTLPLQQIINEYDEGKKNWVYSCNPTTGEIVPGPITWAGTTRSNTQVLKLTLDNGEKIICTPDHKFPILGKGFVEAQNLEIGESFIPGYMRKGKINNEDSKEYLEIFDPHHKKWKYVHRFVSSYFKEMNDSDYFKEFVFDSKYNDREKVTVHHVDLNKYNNNPDNLIWMSPPDHIMYHAHLSKTFWKNLRNDPVAYKKHVETCVERFRLSHQKPENIAKWKDEHMIKCTDEMMYYFIDTVLNQPLNPEYSLKKTVKFFNETDIKLLKMIKDNNQKLSDQTLLNRFTAKLLKRIVELGGFKNWSEFIEYILEENGIERDYSYYKFDDHIFELFASKHALMKNGETQQDLIDTLNEDSDFIDAFNELHKNGRVGNNVEICWAYIQRLVEYYGYKNYRDFSKRITGKAMKRKSESVIAKYKIDDSILPAVKSVYKQLSDNIHYTQKTVGFKSFYPALAKDSTFVEAFNALNPDKQKNRFGPDLVRDVLVQLGFDSFDDFKEKYPYLNHKLVSIEWLDKTMDTGTITVDGDEKYHNYHTFLLESGIFTKNSGGGANVLDASYSPLAINEDFFFPTTADGRGSKVEILPGGQNLGEINDLIYFNNKLMRGLRIPSSYLPTGPEDGTKTYDNGRVGTALIQEWRFNQYCKRLQGLVVDNLDKEFKMFLRWRGFNIDSTLFKLFFNEPQNFAANNQAELDNVRISTFTQLEALPYMSKRFLIKRYLGLTETEMSENERLWEQEQNIENKDESDEDISMRSAGISPGGMQTDLDAFGGLEGEMGAGGEVPGTPGTPGAAGGAGTGAVTGGAGAGGGAPGGL